MPSLSSTPGAPASSKDSAVTDRPAPNFRLWIFCVVVKLTIFAIAGRAYGYLSDELYFLDAAEHLALGYVDFPACNRLVSWRG